MLKHTKKIKEMYEEIQRKLLYIIPEKWESIHLYSSIIENSETGQTGELFFYYIPKGIFRKNPVNVYEVPSKFNIDETQYVSLVQNLYEDIKQLRNEFKKNNQGKIWSNLTISITNIKFRAEYGYENLLSSEFNSYEHHVIWRYKYLGIGPEQISKKDKEILYRYFNSAKNIEETEEYSAGIYIEQDTQNIFDYNTQEDDFESDDYISAIEEVEEKELDKKYNNIQSHKIENNWEANVRKKVKTMWSRESKSSKPYIIKPAKKHDENITAKNTNIIKDAKTQSKVNKGRAKEKKLDVKLEKNKKAKMKTNIKKEENRTIRNQILFSEDETNDD